MKTTIGFFGDSFCTDRDSKQADYETYISMLAKHYDADITNLGIGGSSIGDLILLQLNPLIENNTVPDICIFVWTEPDRLFHRTYRSINLASVEDNRKQNEVYDAAYKYYLNLQDEQFNEIQGAALLEYVDNNILTKLPKDTKLVHLWSYGVNKNWVQAQSWDPTNLTYLCEWKNGVEIRPSLMSISQMDNTTKNMVAHQGPNHLTSKLKNELVFNLIKNAIDSQ